VRVPGGHADTNPKGSTVAPDPDLYGPPERGNEDGRPPATLRDWLCPACGGRLSYGVYCKTCKTEPGIQWRPATERDVLLAALPPPSYPEFIND